MIRNLHILVVDDDPEVLDLLGTFLESRGYQVETRSNAHEGLDAIRDTHFDLVITDIAMAGMDGFEFLRIVRATHPDIAIVLATAYEDQYPLSEALRAGADGYLTKPFSLDKLSLIFERAYWEALSRADWYDALDDGDHAIDAV